MDEHSSPIWTILGRRGIAELVDASDYAAKLVVASLRYREPYLSRIVGLPCGDLTTEGVVLVASRKPRDVGHVERDKPRRGNHAAIVVVVPSSSRTVGLNLRNLVTAVPRRGSDLAGEVLGSDALALEVVCHLVSGDSIPNSVYERLGFLFNDFAAPIGGGDVSGGLAMLDESS